MSPLRYRAIFVSDVHLGTRDAQGEFLLDFLRHTSSQYLYLVGDIFDLWKMKNGWYWPTINNEIVRLVLDKALNGTEVLYIPGNHDEAIRDYTGTEINGVRIAEEAVHRTADGKEMLVMHGDEFDAVVKHNRWITFLAFVGGGFYEVLVLANRWFNHLRRRLGFQYWSLSAYIKHKVKNAVQYMRNFETAVMLESRRRKVDGLICGHIHRAAIEVMEGVIYANSGDWVESCTALTEDDYGRLRVVRWAEESALLLDQEELYANSDRDRCLAPAD